jgi:hypothetical protein
VLERLAKDDSGKLATIAYGLLPRDVFINCNSSRLAIWIRFGSFSISLRRQESKTRKCILL